MGYGSRIELLEHRVIFLEGEINKLKKQYSELQNSIPKEEIKPSPELVHSVEIKPSTEQASSMEIKPSPEPTKTTQPENQSMPTVEIDPRLLPKQKNVETFIGKIAMAIGASLLIFIAMGMFAYLLMPVLGDVIKIAGMFIFSFAFLAAGEIHAKKKGMTKWNTSLVGCGSGAVFISLFVTYSHFHAINALLLYLFLILWSGLNCYFARKKNIVFAIIGQLGIFISAILSIGEVWKTSEFMIVVGMLLLSEVSFFASDCIIKNYWNGLITGIGTTLSLSVVTCVFYERIMFANETGILGVAILFTVLAVIYYSALITIRWADTRNKKILSQIQLLLTIFPVSCMILYSPFGNFGQVKCRNIADLTLLFISVAYFLFVNKVYTSETKEMNIISQIYMCFVGICSTANLIEHAYTTPMLVIQFVVPVVLGLLAILYGRIKNNYIVRFYVLLNYTVCVFTWFLYDKVQFALSVIMILAIIMERVLTKKENAKLYYDIFLIPFVIIGVVGLDFFAKFIWDLPNEFATVLRIVLPTAIMVYTYFKDYAVVHNADGSKGKYVFAIYNCFLNLWFASSMLNNGNEGDWYIALAMLILCSLNVQYLLQKYKWAGAYISGKYTLLAALFMTAYGIYGITFSIVYLLIAILSIIIGFIMHYKAMRLFGLALSIFSIVKLIMIDIIYDELLYRAIGFLVCGLLCFAISYIYNKLDKRN